MTRAKRYRSDALRSLHEIAKDLHAVGAIDKATMRDFDLGCLTPVEPLAPEAIKHIREQSHMSQATFARALNVSTVLISKWERGEVRPSGPSLKLLALADKKGIDAILRGAAVAYGAAPASTAHSPYRIHPIGQVCNSSHTFRQSNHERRAVNAGRAADP